MIWPVDKGVLTDKFGKVLVRGSKNIFMNNEYLIIAAAESANVGSINNGKVSYIGNISDDELLVIINHNEINNAYINIKPNIKIGQTLSRGQIIGTIDKSNKGQYSIGFGVLDEKGNFM